MLRKKSLQKSIQILDTTEELSFSNKHVKEMHLSVTKQQFCFVLLMRFLVEDQVSYGSYYFLFNNLVCRFHNIRALCYNYHTNNFKTSITTTGKKGIFEDI